MIGEKSDMPCGIRNKISNRTAFQLRNCIFFNFSPKIMMLPLSKISKFVKKKIFYIIQKV